MGAWVYKEFDKGFVIDEERLRKLNSIISNRLHDLGENITPTYIVFRADAFRYETKDIEDILKEDNAEWRKLNAISIEYDPKDKSNTSFVFALDDLGRNFLRIEGEDRDFVFLFASELREYVENEVFIYNKDRKLKYVDVLYYSFELVLVLFGVFFFIRSFPIDSGSSSLSVDEILGSDDLQEKLNFLIEERVERFGLPPIDFIILIIIGVIVSLTTIFERGVKNRLVIFANKISPSYVFLIGRELERQSQRQKLRDNIIWVVIIGTIMSILGGLIVYLITK